MTATSVSGVWPLTGRAEETRLIAENLTEGDAPGGVAITGRAGIGKTRLAREAAKSVSAGSAPVRWTAGTQSAQTIPLGAFAEWADASGGGPIGLIGSVIEALTAAPSGARAVIVVDDAHLLDAQSAFVLHQIVLRRSASVIVTIRSGAAVPDAVTALWKDGYLPLLELQPLSCAEAHLLLCGALTGDVDADCARRMWESTGGNVLYLRHLVAQETAARRLMNTAGTWTWMGTPVMSETLTDLIESQVGLVPEPVLEAVDLVAIAEPLELELLAALVSPPVLEDAEQRGLLAVTSSGATTSVRVGHPLYGEIRRDRAAASRLRRLRARVASELAKRADLDDADTVRLGVLWLDSDLATEPELLFNAAHAAFLRFDFELAARLAQASKRAGGPADASLLEAQALALMNRADESQEILAELRDSSLDDRQLAYSIALRACNLWAQLDRPQESRELVDTALDASSAVVRESAQALRALQLAMQARPTEALAMAEAVNRDRLGDFQALTAAWALVVALGDTGRMREVTPVAIEGYRRAARSPEAAFLEVGLAEHHVKALLLAGCIEEALAASDAACRRCADSPGISGAFGSAIAATALLGSGRANAARSQLRTASAVFAARDAAAGVRYRFMLVEVEALAKLGDLPAATAALEYLQPGKQPIFSLLQSDLLLAEAWVEAAGGAVSRAVVSSRRAAEFAQTHGQSAREVLSLQAATHFGDMTTVDRLEELQKVVEGPRARAVFEFATGLAARDGAILQAASQKFEVMGDMFAAADVSAHSAIAYRREGLRGTALTAAGRAQRLAHECEGVVSPALREAAQPLPLTPREQEIISLVAQGLSNRQIAEAMGISVRTVEGHIYRASLRSGVANRSELGALLREYRAS